MSVRFRVSFFPCFGSLCEDKLQSVWLQLHNCCTDMISIFPPRTFCKRERSGGGGFHSYFCIREKRWRHCCGYVRYVWIYVCVCVFLYACVCVCVCRDVIFVSDRGEGHNSYFDRTLGFGPFILTCLHQRALTEVNILWQREAGELETKDEPMLSPRAAGAKCSPAKADQWSASL